MRTTVFRLVFSLLAAPAAAQDVNPQPLSDGELRGDKGESGHPSVVRPR